MATQATQPQRTETQTVLLEMFQENTGAHMLDSGGAYGRNWERNQGKDLFEEPMIDAQYARNLRSRDGCEVSSVRE
jgi:hypothetical protein